MTLLGEYPRFLKHKQFSFHQVKELIFLNVQYTPHHAMHIRAYIEAQKDIKMASNEGEDPSNYYALVAISSDKKKPLKLCGRARLDLHQVQRSEGCFVCSPCRQEIWLLGWGDGSSLGLRLEDFIP